MEERIIDFRSAAAEIANAMLKPKAGCVYGHHSEPLKVALAMDEHNNEIKKRSKLLSKREVEQSLRWVEEWHTPSKALSATINRIKGLCYG